MPEVHPVAKLLIFGGIGLIALGLIVQLIAGLGLNIGRLPGDIIIERDNFKVYIPLGTMILLSIVASVALTLITRLFGGNGR